MPKKETDKKVVVPATSVVEANVETTQRFFTEAELFYITEKSKTHAAYDIAQTLKCTIDEVRQHMPTQAETTQAEPSSSMMKNLMAGQSRSGTRTGMRVMTSQASEFADATRDTRISQSKTIIQGREVNCIHKPLG